MSTQRVITLIVVLLIAILPSTLDACFASGICGGGGGGCAPPLPPICSGGCGPGYGKFRFFLIFFTNFIKN